MNDERTFTDDEVARILDDATETHASGGALASASGLTISELKDIAREVGIPDSAIDRAVANLDTAPPVPVARRTFLGQTIGVGREVTLPRALTDEEWHRLVIDLRETFDAKGKISDEGAFRQWTNSNLQALLEPTSDGHRLRLRTLKGNAQAFQAVGAAFVGVSGLLSVMQFLGRPTDVSDIVMFGVMGAAFFLGSRLTVPSWARTRAEQFEQIIARVQQRLASHPVSGGGAAELSSGGGVDEP